MLVGTAPRVCLVGPLPPPEGGMAHQCALLLQCLRAQGLQVELVQTNAPHRPAWVAAWVGLRALCRLLPFVGRLWRATGRCDLVHVMANSGWAWHLFAAPAIAVAKLRRLPVIAHYHGGNAQVFLASQPYWARCLLAWCSLRVLPSAYLQRVFAGQGLSAWLIPNAVDLARFHSACVPALSARPRHILVSRNLEPLYGLDTALRAFALVQRKLPAARLLIAGSGSEQARLQALAAQLQVRGAVDFLGRVPNAAIPALLAQTACLLNPSRVDNMPISILEAFAAGVPVVSTCAGGIPDLLQHGTQGLLVAVDDAPAMAEQVLRVLQQPALAQTLSDAGRLASHSYSAARVLALWLQAYQQAQARPVRRAQRTEGAP